MLSPPLGGRVHARLGDRVQRPLGKGREGAHLFDLVAEELHAQRLTAGRGEDVDDASTDGELPSLVDAVDALVARARERLGEAVQPRLFADHETHRPRTRGRRRHPFGDCGGRRADQAAGDEDVERASPLADEMRRGLEPRGVRDAPAREQPDDVRPQEPRCPLCCVARVGILGKEDQQPAPELLVQRREDERERRLGNTRSGGERGCERLEPLAPAQLGDE